jgi:AcrR family transcriptional regulator
MARPKSETKRNDILSAAARVFAEQGLGASTSAISKAAGVAEGTLFIYFKTKHALFNALYRQLKVELADAMMAGYPRKLSVRQRLQHVWDCFVKWGVANPAQRKALLLLEASVPLNPEFKTAGEAPFQEILMMAQEAIDQRLFRDTSLEFILGTMRALAQNTMDFMIADRKTSDAYLQTGFEMFWAAIIRKKS